MSGCTADVETTLDVSKYLPEGVVVTKESAYINVKIAIEKSVTRDASKLSYGDNTITLSVPDGDKYTVVNTCTVMVKVTETQ